MKSNCNKVAVKYSPTYESSMLYCTSNNMHESLHLVYTVVQGSKVSCGQLNRPATVRVQLSLKPSSHNMNSYPYSYSRKQSPGTFQSHSIHPENINADYIIKSQLTTICCADTMGPNLKNIIFPTNILQIKVCEGIVGLPVTGAQDLF